MKSISFLRSGVADIPAMMASTLPEVRAGGKPSHSNLTISSSKPSWSASLLATCTSYPFAYSPGEFETATAPFKSDGWDQLKGA